MGLTNLEYQYGPDGQLTAILDKIDPLKSRFISYDDLNRLVQVDQGLPPIDGGVPVPVEDYAYDKEGNRTASHLSALYSSNAHNQLEEDEAYNYAYDQRGNRVSKTSKATGDVETYAYDSQNRLVGYTNGTTTASYAYDALDRRIAKTVDGEVTAFVYDMSADDPLAHDDIVLEYADDILTRRWLHSKAVDEPVGFEDYASTSGVGSGQERSMFADRQGSVIWGTEPATGTALAAYEYDGYGQINQTQGTLQQPYGYTGREYDAESGLYHYRARAYDPVNGHFIQTDPLGFGGGSISLYQYVEGNTFGQVDPLGLMSTVPFTKKSLADHADSTLTNSYVFAGVAGAAGAITRTLLEFDLAITGTDVDSIPKESGICSPEMQAWFDSIKPHTGECIKGRAALRTNLVLMQEKQYEIFVRTLELAACYEGGVRGDEGHPQRITVLFSQQKRCAKYIKNAVYGIGKL